MWNSIAKLILKNRIRWLIGIGLVTIFMGYWASQAKMRYEFTGLLPATDIVAIQHADFIKQYGQDGNVFVVGTSADTVYQLDNFLAWKELGDNVRAIPGVDSVFSLANLYRLRKDEKDTLFRPEPLMKTLPKTQAELDSLRAKIETYPFYDDLLYNGDGTGTLMMVFMNNERFNSKERYVIMDSVMNNFERFRDRGINLHYSGLPHIRNIMTTRVKGELNMFIVLSGAITGLILLFFFRSFKVMAFCMLVCGIAVTFSLGTIGIFGYKISMLMGLIPPLIIVIGIPNCVYLLNKYQAEFTDHGNKIKALHRVVRKVGNATFLTNTTTALGFATFIFVDSEMLREFGIVASVNIMIVFFLSILLVPIIFSFLADPKEKHTKHLKQKWINNMVEGLVNMASNHRRLVYLVTAVVIGLGIYGVTLVETTGNIVDDLPEDDDVLVDLHWFEDKFRGVMPFEILVDTKEDKAATATNALKKIEKLQVLLTEYPEFSKSLSLADALKFAHQCYYKSNDPKYNKFPKGAVTADLLKYIANTSEKTGGEVGMTKTFLDDNARNTRVSVHVADIGTYAMDSLLLDVTPRVDSVFNPKRAKYDSIFEQVFADGVSKQLSDSLMHELVSGSRRVRRFLKRTLISADPDLEAAFEDYPDTLYTVIAAIDTFPNLLHSVVEEQYYDITFTGTSVVYVKGTDYMVKNLFTSLLIAICIIALIMALLFSSVRMVLVSLLPNLIPLVFTAAIMGYFGIAIKPSTILVFSIAFGISIDDTIHFLAKYRQELKSREWDIKGSVLTALRETGVSMIYTSIILFFGFSMFGASTFGGIVSLGILVSVTLLVAMLANLVLLPALLLSLEKAITTKAFNKEPLLEIFDEEEDIDLEDLVVQRRKDPSPQNQDEE